MSLKVIRRRDCGGTLWITGTVRPAGAETGVRIRRRAGTDDERLAREEAAALEAQILREAWHGKRAAAHGFAEAVTSYLKHEPRSAGTKALIRRLLVHVGDAPLAALNQAAVDKARDALLKPEASPSTVRRNLIVPLRAVLIHASKRGWCAPPQFDIPAEPKGRTRFMLPEQVQALIEAAGTHLRPLLRFLACTGCRMSEALGLDWSEVDLQAARAILWEGETKGGTRRVVLLSPAAVATLAKLPGRDGRVFRDHRGNPYRGSEEYGGQIKTAWRNALRRAELAGFTPHDLRHTWASWHYAIHRDLLRLKTEGGWSSVALVERYAHIMPAGHEDAIRAFWGLWHVADTGASSTISKPL
jgi:integrase